MSDLYETSLGDQFEKEPQAEGELKEGDLYQDTQEQVELLDQPARKEKEKSYLRGEVPQSFLFDPEQFLPLNTDKLAEGADLARSIQEIEEVTSDEIASIHKFQRSIDAWEKTIEKNKSLIDQNKEIIRQNNLDISYDEKNRDYWWRRAENVESDFGIASASDHRDTWAWFIKKHGLKTADGNPIDEECDCVEELCNGSSSNLSSKYKIAGNKYDMSKNHRESENFRIIAENSQYKKTLETLKNYVQMTYQKKIEPLQDGVLLLKELMAKLRELLNEEGATHGELREWAEHFLDEYIIENPLTPQHAISDYRKWASIPLPSENH